jgi:hypothetical protein
MSQKKIRVTMKECPVESLCEVIGHVNGRVDALQMH